MKYIYNFIDVSSGKKKDIKAMKTMIFICRYSVIAAGLTCLLFLFSLNAASAETSKAKRRVISATSWRPVISFLSTFDQDRMKADKLISELKGTAISDFQAGKMHRAFSLSQALVNNIRQLARQNNRDRKRWDKIDTELKGCIDRLSILSKELSGDSQMEMFQIQSTMSARQSAIHLTSNMMSALGDAQKEIAGNLKGDDDD